MPPIWIQSNRIWFAASGARERSVVDRSNSVVAVVLAASATEAFINEITANLQMTRDLPAHFKALADALSDVEESRGPLTLKYLIAGHLLGRPFDRGANPFQDFSTLISLRNDAMHVKQRDRFIESPDSGFQIEWPKYVKSLQQRGLLLQPPGAPIMPSFDAVQTPKIAAWACEVSAAMVRAILDMFPDEDVAGRDPVFVIKLAWQWLRKQEKGAS